MQGPRGPGVEAECLGFRRRYDDAGISGTVILPRVEVEPVVEIGATRLESRSVRLAFEKTRLLQGRHGHQRLGVCGVLRLMWVPKGDGRSRSRCSLGSDVSGARRISSKRAWSSSLSMKTRSSMRRRQASSVAEDRTRSLMLRDSYAAAAQMRTLCFSVRRSSRRCQPVGPIGIPLSFERWSSVHTVAVARICCKTPTLSPR